jgi:hypothetical protein
MSGRRTVVTVVAAAVWAAIALPVVPSYAANPVTDVFVAMPDNGGNDANDCSSASPCASVAAAIFAVDDGGTLHVGAGTFDGPVRPGALGKSVVIVGVSPSATTLIASPGTDGYDATVVELYSTVPITTSLSDLTVSGGQFAGIDVVDGNSTVHVSNVTATGGGCDLYVAGGTVDVSGSTFSDGGTNGACGPFPDAHPADVAVDGGALSVTQSQLLVSVTNVSALAVNGGSTTIDQSFFDGSSNQNDGNQTRGILATAGSATADRSTFNGFDTGVFNSGGSTLLRDDTFSDNVEGVTGGTGSTTVVRGTFIDQLGGVYAPAGSTIGVAGSIFDLPSNSPGKNCVGTVVDLGYNLSADDSCAFASTTGHDNVAGLNLDTGIADRGGPVPTVAILNPSAAVDTIPVGATYGDPATPLCPVTDATDLRGVPRPAGGACDAGSMEMAATATVVDGPAKAAPHAATTFDAEVGVPASTDVDGLGLPVGTVTFTSGDQGLCLAVPVSSSGEAQCTTSALGVGLRSVVATFAPGSGSTLHASTSAPVTTKVGTVPVITAPGRVVVHVGTKVSIVLRASGKPAPVLRLRKGPLPRGLRFHRGTGRATITGTPKRSAAGRYHLRVRATNPMGSDVHALTLVVRRR